MVIIYNPASVVSLLAAVWHSCFHPEAKVLPYGGVFSDINVIDYSDSDVHVLSESSLRNLKHGFIADCFGAEANIFESVSCNHMHESICSNMLDVTSDQFRFGLRMASVASRFDEGEILSADDLTDVFAWIGIAIQTVRGINKSKLIDLNLATGTATSLAEVQRYLKWVKNEMMFSTTFRRMVFQDYTFEIVPIISVQRDIAVFASRLARFSHKYFIIHVDDALGGQIYSYNKDEARLLVQHQVWGVAGWKPSIMK